MENKVTIEDQRRSSHGIATIQSFIRERPRGYRGQ